MWPHYYSYLTFCTIKYELLRVYKYSHPPLDEISVSVDSRTHLNILHSVYSIFLLLMEAARLMKLRLGLLTE